jgi:hypothetical protein
MEAEEFVGRFNHCTPQSVVRLTLFAAAANLRSTVRVKSPAGNVDKPERLISRLRPVSLVGRRTAT